MGVEVKILSLQQSWLLIGRFQDYRSWFQRLHWVCSWTNGWNSVRKYSTGLLLKVSMIFWWQLLLLRRGNIPNANTLFIEKCRPYGLVNLVSIKGRVGRSNRIAYAYLMYRPEKSISEVSEKRLEAIKGIYRIRLRFKVRCEIFRFVERKSPRKIQSGFIDSVGFGVFAVTRELLLNVTVMGIKNQRKCWVDFTNWCLSSWYLYFWSTT